MIRAQAAEFAPITAAWSSAVHARPCSAANVARTSSHQISESTRTPSRSKMTASIRGRSLRAAVGASPAGRTGGRGLRRGRPLGRAPPSPGVAGSRPGTSRAGHRPPRTSASAKAAIASAVVVGAVEDLALDLERHEAMAALDLDRQLAELDALPADDLAAGARALARDVHPDVDLERARSAVGDEQHVARTRVVAPRHPALGVGLGAERPASAASTTARTLGATESLNGAFARQPLHRIRPPVLTRIARSAGPSPGEASTAAVTANP